MAKVNNLATLNIIEPTLSTQAGHCFSFVNSVVRASAGAMSLRLWVNRQARLHLAEKQVELRRHFHRWWRRPQLYFLLRKLLQTSEKIFISTASYTDLRLFDWAAGEPVPPGKVYFYVHWFNPSDSKLSCLKQIALRQPNLMIFGPTQSVVDVFRRAGFGQAQLIPYPISVRQADAGAATAQFRHLLFAGAARRDKGFGQVVDLVEYLHTQGSRLPVTIQMSAQHFGKYDAETLADIKRLQAISYPFLKMLTDTLSVDEYEALFPGAIALQLYSVDDFSDRISGVTLDAFSGGCPVLTTASTWIASMVERFDAGVVTTRVDPAFLVEMIEPVIADYARYAANASRAGVALQAEHSAGTLFEALAA